MVKILDMQDTYKSLLSATVEYWKHAIQMPADEREAFQKSIFKNIDAAKARGEISSAQSLDLFSRMIHPAGMFEQPDFPEAWLQDEKRVGLLNTLLQGIKNYDFNGLKQIIQKSEMKQLLQEGQERFDNWLLKQAVLSDDPEMVRFFVEELHITLYRCKNDPLKLAVEKGNLEIVTCLYDRKYWKDTRQAFQRGLHEIHLAARSGHIEILDFVLKKEGTYELRRENASGFIAFEEAARADQAAMVKHLIDKYGANPNHVFPWTEGKRLLHVAAESDRIDLIKMLVEEYGPGPDGDSYIYVEPFDRDKKGNSALHFAAGKSRQPKMFAYLINECGLDANDSGGDGNTPLHLASHYGNSAGAQCLLKTFKVNPSPLNFKDETPLDLADSDELISVLEQSGAQRGSGKKGEPEKIGIDSITLWQKADIVHAVCIPERTDAIIMATLDNKLGLYAIDTNQTLWEQECEESIENLRVESGLITAVFVNQQVRFYDYGGKLLLTVIFPATLTFVSIVRTDDAEGLHLLFRKADSKKAAFALYAIRNDLDKVEIEEVPSAGNIKTFQRNYKIKYMDRTKNCFYSYTREGIVLFNLETVEYFPTYPFKDGDISSDHLLSAGVYKKTDWVDTSDFGDSTEITESYIRLVRLDQQEPVVSDTKGYAKRVFVDWYEKRACVAIVHEWFSDGLETKLMVYNTHRVTLTCELKCMHAFRYMDGKDALLVIDDQNTLRLIRPWQKPELSLKFSTVR